MKDIKDIKIKALEAEIKMLKAILSVNKKIKVKKNKKREKLIDIVNRKKMMDNCK